MTPAITSLSNVSSVEAATWNRYISCVGIIVSHFLIYAYAVCVCVGERTEC